MIQTGPRASSKFQGRRRRTAGAQVLEFTLNFMPFLAMTMLVTDTAWVVFGEATIQEAVRIAVRQGVTLTASQVSTNLTSTVKGIVQAHSAGLLNGTTNYGYIKVHYFNGQNPSQDVSNQTWGNIPGNIMQVSVENYSLNPLIVRLFRLKDTPDNSPLTVTVYAADVIEPMSTSQIPPIGSAP
jgi:hypothetical protein